MSAFEAILKSIPYVRRPFFQRDRALAELEIVRARGEFLSNQLQQLAEPPAADCDRVRRSDLWFVSPNDDARQDREIGDFRSYIRTAIPRTAQAMEIGPSFEPTIPKRDGYNVRILDHEDQARLVEKYKPHSVDVSKIEPVDLIWRGENIQSLVGAQKFDAIVAAHVIEHAPDFVQMLTDCSA